MSDNKLITTSVQTFELDPDRAVADLAEQIGSEPVSALLYFVSPKYDFAAISERLHRAIGAPSLGCTTAGEVCSAVGHCEDGVVAMALRHPGLELRTAMIEDAKAFNSDRAGELISPLLASDNTDAEQFGIVLIDGLSMAEEQVSASLAHVMKDTPFVGGSAGDDLNFKQTMVACDGVARAGAAVVGVMHSTLPFRVFHSHHFDPTDTRLVITKAIASERRVLEVNGEPAAEGYARAVGIKIDELNSHIFAAHPVLLKIGGNFYVRSIQKVHDDGSLTFFCAIDEGLVLRVAKAKNLPDSLHDEILRIEGDLGSVGAIIGFDCILRRLELMTNNQREQVHAAFSHLPFVGFSTYGEQFNGLHVNQTITGVAIGRAA